MFDSPLAQTQNAQNYVDIMVQIRKYTSELENDTPTIVAFGDQSAGKSSLMQRLTGGIPVPKGVGRCTATPFEIRMMQTQEPIRRISLRYVENSKRIATSPSEIDFCDILDMEHEKIEDKLREAQRYVLNPSIKVQDSPISDTLGNKDELMFTRNAICVTIGDPNQKFSLAMVDLPGIIRDNQENEDFVISLVKEYINKDTTILLPIFQATADIATQSAWKLAKEADPSGKRTVGVLTKIDQISDDEIKHKALANFVEGKGEHQLVNGVYVVRNPASSKENFEDHESIEKNALSHLMLNKSWRNVPSNRLGLKHLIDKLSDLQKLALDLAWPKIRPFLQKRRSELEAELSSIPPAPKGNPIIRFIEIIGIFDKEFTNHADANDIDHRLYRGQQWNFGEFDRVLLNTRPRYNLSIDNQLMNQEFDPIRPGALQVRGWTDKLLNEIGADEWSKDEGLIANESEYTWDMKQLCEKMQEAQGGQLVGYFPYKAIVSIVARHQKEWYKISHTLLDKNAEWEETLKQLLDLEKMEHMSASRALYVTDEATLLKKQYKYYMEMRVLSANKEIRGKLTKIIDLGGKYFDAFNNRSSTPTSSDTTNFENIKNELIKVLSENQTKDEVSQRLIEDIKSSNGKTPSTATVSMMITAKNMFLEKLINKVPKNSDSKQNSELLSSTINEQAFLAATGALAYWKMVHSRFRETVPRVVEYYLVHKFSSRLGTHLRRYFGFLTLGREESSDTLEENDDIIHRTSNRNDDLSDSVPDLDHLLGENPEFTEKREKLEEEIKTLSMIIDKVRRITTNTN
ncbi:4199_t:CDS:2 [Entrophospora sp. SA101]|nr:4199_t:CDS:2 [Entrophospora sp. SA101]